VRLLLDNNLSPSIVAGLRDAGHEARHVREIGLAAADDVTVLAEAGSTGAVLISSDTDFGTLLYESRSAHPSVVLFRQETSRRPDRQLRILVGNLPLLVPDLEAGCIAVVMDSRIRVRRLPLLG
jgi:predicted nuclease of predicted toxin-antitoxin system